MMDKSILLPDGTFIKDVNDISMITPVEVRENQVKSKGFFKKPEVKYIYYFSVTITPTLGKVEEIEFEYDDEKTAEEDRQNLIKEIQFVLSSQSAVEVETIENYLEIPTMMRGHSTKMKLTKK